MKIAFDAKRLFFNHTGLGNYSRSLVRSYRGNFPDNDVMLFTPKIKRSQYLEFTSDDYELVSPMSPVLWRYYFMNRQIKHHRPDIYHGLSNEVPRGIANNKHTKFLVTIHDLIFLRYPKLYNAIDRAIYYEKFKRSSLTADHVVAVSESTKADLVSFFHVRPEKVSVIYQSCAEEFYQPFQQEQRQDYALIVSSVSERKNLKLVVDAWKLMQQEDRIQVKVVGGGGRHKIAMQRYVQDAGLEKYFSFLGHVANNELLLLYRKALFTIYPSLYEGYGIPVLESLLQSTPVITSNLSSMPEAGSGFAILVDPHSPSELKEAVANVKKGSGAISANDLEKLRDLHSSQKRAYEVQSLYKKLMQT